ncbi:hypothetical protein PG994_009745 [Apiospora phragmitis]|uniref:Uncharacterized protein n=1 Tax=Apiospora phragmitis TaxID=2905665 RepID=A0ABR1U9Q2_9PEZI
MPEVSYPAYPPLNDNLGASSAWTGNPAPLYGQHLTPNNVPAAPQQPSGMSVGVSSLSASDRCGCTVHCIHTVGGSGSSDDDDDDDDGSSDSSSQSDGTTMMPHNLDVLIAHSQALGGVQVLDPLIHQAHESVVLVRVLLNDYGASLVLVIARVDHGLGLPGCIVTGLVGGFLLLDGEVLLVRILLDVHRASLAALILIIIRVVCDDLLGSGSDGLSGGLARLLGLRLLLLLLLVDHALFLGVGLLDE